MWKSNLGVRRWGGLRGPAGRKGGSHSGPGEVPGNISGRGTEGGELCHDGQPQCGLCQEDFVQGSSTGTAELIRRTNGMA